MLSKGKHDELYLPALSLERQAWVTLLGRQSAAEKLISSKGMVNLMKYRNGARVLLVAILLIVGGSMVGAAFSRLGLFLVGGACLALLLDAFDYLLAGRRSAE